jgi:hypothetical protein
MSSRLPVELHPIAILLAQLAPLAHESVRGTASALFPI